MIYDSPYDFLNSICLNVINFKLIALDIGLKKTGTAKFNSMVNVVLPGEIIATNQIINVIEGFDGVIIGLQEKAIEENTEVGKKVLDVARQIMKPVYFIDEKYTTKIANNMLKETGMRRKDRNKVDDSVAAKILLEDFLKLTGKF